MAQILWINASRKKRNLQIFEFSHFKIFLQGVQTSFGYNFFTEKVKFCEIRILKIFGKNYVKLK